MAKGFYDDQELTLTAAEVSTYYATRLPQLRQRGRYWRCPCPIHAGDSFSFSINSETGRWRCHSQCGTAGDLYDFEQHFGGGAFPDVKRRVFDIIGRRPLQFVPRPRIVRAAFSRATQLAAAAMDIRAGACRPLLLRVARIIFLRLDIVEHGQRIQAMGHSVARWRRIDSQLDGEMTRLLDAVATIESASGPDLFRATFAVRKAKIA